MMKKQKVKPKSPNLIRMPKAHKSTTLRKSTKKFSFFKKNSTKRSFKVRKHFTATSKILIIPVAFILLGGLLYISIKYVLSLRNNAFGSKSYIINDVTGLQGIPQYPGSVFTYEYNKEDSTIKEFLSSGNSTYRLPNDTDTEDVETYYKEILPAKGWEFVNTVPIGTEDKKYGQYWVKDGKGLRIYIKFKDVWYESITEHDSRTALADKVQEEIEREMLLASSDKQDLLPDFPWKIQIPKEYLITYGATDFEDFTSVSFQRIGTNEKITLYPVKYKASQELDYILENYCTIISTDESAWKIQNTFLTSFDSQAALKGTLVSNDKILFIAVIQNNSNNIVYVLSSTKENDPMFGYLLDNMKPIDVN